MGKMEQIITLLTTMGLGAKEAFYVYLGYNVVIHVLWASVLFATILFVVQLIRKGLANDRLLKAMNGLMEDVKPDLYWSSFPEFNVDRIIDRAMFLKSKVGKK